MPDELKPAVASADLLTSLSPSNQRLVRELILKLSPATTLAPFDYSTAIPAWHFHLVATGKSPSCVRSYSTHVRLLLTEYPFPTRADVDFYFSRLLSTGYSVASINIKLAAFRSLGAFCYDNSLTDSAPFSRIKSLKVPIRERTCPSESDMSRLLSHPLSPRDLSLFTLFADTGVRLTELTHLHIPDVFPDSVRVIGKGNKQRSLPLAPLSQLILSAYLFTQHPDSIYVFPGRYPTNPLSSWRVEEILKQLCLQCGVPSITPHQIRHYFATYLLNHGANLKVVSELLGHSSADITARIYWHVDAGAKKEAHDNYGPLSHPSEVIKNAP